jgi:hypothetical protein
MLTSSTLSTHGDRDGTRTLIQVLFACTRLPTAVAAVVTAAAQADLRP